MASPDAPNNDLVWLLHQVGQGNRAAMAEIADQYAGRLYGYAFRRVSNEQDAEDLVQITMLEIWSDAGRCTGQSSSEVEGWIFRICHNKIVDFWRRHSTAMKYLDKLGLSQDQGASSIESMTNISLVLLPALEEALKSEKESIRKECEMIIDLHFVEQFSRKEIAAILNCSVETIDRRIGLIQSKCAPIYHGVSEDEL